MTLVVKNPHTNPRVIRDVGSIPGLRRSPGGGHGNPLQYSCLENSMDRGDWWPVVHRITQSWTQLKQWSMYAKKIPGEGILRTHVTFFPPKISKSCRASGFI